MNRVILVSAFGALLLACGGGGSGTSFADPHAVQFTYAGYSSPDISEQAAADSGVTGAADVYALKDTSDEAHAESLANLPDTMAGALFDSIVPTAAQVQAARARSAFSARAAAYAAGDLVAATDGFDPDCITVLPLSVTYDHCTYSYSDIDGTATVTLNGSLTRGLTSVEWDVTLAMDMTLLDTGGNIGMHIAQHMKGDIAVTELAADSWDIAGEAKSDWGVSASGRGQSVSFAFTHWVGLDLVYQPSISCVVDGTVELKRVWGRRPPGYSASELPNVGVMFDWIGCDTVQVSWGVL